ncbi:GDP-L-galactose phosphorylase 1 [Actinidia rufa]|uniref:GDP-L-galactose phosphorylase 1 n=1 Tax=Actinidia rufa TaxID=165716 RepID=A0A7J0E3A3_9ERIC|nr:GDP-L-galactose phosphorylase 1 [Actinidia rufa]
MTLGVSHTAMLSLVIYIVIVAGIGGKLPLYAFKRVKEVVGEKGLLAIDDEEAPVTFLDSLLLGEWEDRVQRGLFHYDVTACETKVFAISFSSGL